MNINLKKTEIAHLINTLEVYRQCNYFDEYEDINRTMRRTERLIDKLEKTLIKEGK